MRLAAQAAVVDSRWGAERLAMGGRVRVEEEREAEEELPEEAEDPRRC